MVQQLNSLQSILISLLNFGLRLEDLKNFHAFASRTYRLTSYNRWILQGGSYPGALSAWGRSKVNSASAYVRICFSEAGYITMVRFTYVLHGQRPLGSFMQTTNSMQIQGPLRRTLSIYQTTFRIRLPMLAHGRKSSSFTFSMKLDVFFKFPIPYPPILLCSCFSYFPSCSSFPTARLEHCSEMFSLPITVRRG